MLLDLSQQEVAAVRDLVVEELRRDALPATIITNSRGSVVKVQWGVPTISEIRDLLARGQT